jgi:pyruvate formate-lyase/glycerol dehydratase family glycyl radical enzyme
MTERIKDLREKSYATPVTIDPERALIVTEFYKKNLGKFSQPVMRAKVFYEICSRKTLYLGDNELIIGERGVAPKAVSTYPELTCHSVEDLTLLNDRETNPYLVSSSALELYKEKIIPYWEGRTMKERIFSQMDREWLDAYEAGIFTEFMEQRAPGHTTLDGKFYHKGLDRFKDDIHWALGALDFASDPLATDKREELKAMLIACDAVILLSDRYADYARELSEKATSPERASELLKISEICRKIPRNNPETFQEALQMYWFMHLATITELNGWDAMNPGHLDRYFYPFYQKDLSEGTLTKESAKELLSAFWIKFNNHPAPPKVGVTARESGTYNDFTNINIGGVLPDGSDGVNEISYMMLEVMDEIHLLQPQGNIQLSRINSDHFLKAACRVIRSGYGYPSIFNCDGLIEQMLRVGKSLEDAREGGTSGCVETGAFGKEAYILTGYFNVPKILELTLNNGYDPVTGKKIGLATGELKEFKQFDDLYGAFEKQLNHFINIKHRGNLYIESMYARYAPAVFLSVLTDDCIKNGLDYNAGGARYNTSYIQCVGIGSITDAFSAISTHVYSEEKINLTTLVESLNNNWESNKTLRLQLSKQTPRYGNDNDAADNMMKRIFNSLYQAIEGKRNNRGGEYHVDMLPTTCHIYFGEKTGATADGRFAGEPLSEGISPVQGADLNGPTAVINSCAKMDQLKTGGTLLNMKVLPEMLKTEKGLDYLASLVRTYFQFNGHHIQFNVVDRELLLKAQESPLEHKDLIVRVAGYSDYFCDIGSALQNEIISRTGFSLPGPVPASTLYNGEKENPGS